MEKQDRWNYPYFTGKKTEAQRGKGTVHVEAIAPSLGEWPLSCAGV